MKKQLKILLLIICMISSQMFIYADYDGIDTIVLSKDWDGLEGYKSRNNLPGNVNESIVVKGQTMPFNKELYEEKNVIVYGGFDFVSNNDFKVVVSGYYNENGVSGEYRYHGYDVSGNKHGNDDFPRDASSTTPLEEKVWISRAWEPDSFGRKSFVKHSGEEISDYNYTAIYNLDDPILRQESSVVRRFINEGLNFDIERGTYDGSNVETDLDPVYYSNIQTSPTTRISGQSILFHKSKYDGNTWYQTMPVKPITDKIKTPVECSITEVNVGGVNNSGFISLFIKVEGDLKDESYYNADEITRNTHYNRDDVTSWEMGLSSSNISAKFEMEGKPIRTGEGNKAYANFKVDISYDDYKSFIADDSTFNISLEAYAKANFNLDTSGLRVFSIGYDNDNESVDGGEVVTEIPVVTSPVKFEITAPNEILDVWSFTLLISETNVPEGYDRSVILEGIKLSEAEEQRFLSGSYKFPKILKDKLYNYKVMYSKGTEEYFYGSWVLVYDSVPHASVRVVDYGKINRKNEVTSDYSVTPDFLELNSTISISKFEISSRNNQAINYGINTNSLKEYLVKEIDTVDVNVSVSNEYGSRDYHHEIYAGEDYVPDLISIIWNNNLARNESLDIFSEGASMDGDTVTSLYYEIFFDEDKDGIAEKSVYSKSEFLGKTPYMPDKLGYYEIEFSTTEEFGQPTIEKYIKAEDHKSTKVRREFFVDNLVPMTKVFTDIEYNFPKIDMSFLVDQDFPRTENNYIREHNVDIRNNFRLNSMITSLQTFDMYTYTYSQTAYHRTHSGGSYPQSSYSYNSGGYIGSIPRVDVDNYTYSRDLGKNVTTTSSKTASGSKSQSGSVYLPIRYANNKTPSSISYSSGGYTGTLSRSGGISGYSSSAIKNSAGAYIGYKYSFTQNYSGTVSKSTTTWVSNIKSYNDYYGDYEGIVYKNVKQAFSPTYDIESNKYIVYFATDNLNNLSDFNSVKNIATDSKIILVGNPSIKGSLSEDIFIPYSSDTLSIINKIVSEAKSDNPVLNVRSILVNETFDLNHSDMDEENDPIVEEGFLYIHDPTYFDNSLGQEKNTLKAYDETKYSNEIKTSFEKPGKYEIIRRIKDAPIEDPSKGLYSNLSKLELVVHRKPIALDSLDWTYDNVKGKYLTSWIDRSYDPDYEYSDINRGIINLKVKIRKNGGSWIYGIPTLLDPGSYEKELIVQDKHGVWSDPNISSFNLSSKPTPQILNAELKATLDDFDLLLIPATESITFYDVKTRFPYDENLEVSIYDLLGNKVSKAKKVIFTGANGSLTNQDLHWNEIEYVIPHELSDGNYKARISVVDSVDPLNYVYKDFDISVVTPINLVGILPDSLTSGVSNTISATTSKYADEVYVTLYKGLPSEVTLSMVRVNANNWSVDYFETATINDGIYNARFTAKINSTPVKVEYYDDTFEAISLRAESIVIHGAWNYWRGQTNIFGETTTIEPHRFLSLEKIFIEVETIGDPDEILVTMSEELEAMHFEDDKGNVYSYEELVGYNVNFPTEMKTNDLKEWHLEYILPLAPSTKSIGNATLKSPYFIKITLKKGDNKVEYIIDDINITGNTVDHVFLQRE